MKIQNLNAMDSTSEIGDQILKAGANGDLATLRAIKRKVDDDLEFQRICDGYVDFSNGRNVLHHAAEMGHLHICKFLIKTVEVYVDAFTYKRDTPLMLAVKEESIKIVEYLINQGAEVNMLNSKGFSSLYYAVLKDNMELIKLLLLRGALIDAVSVDGSSLQCAVSHGNVEVVKLLLSRGAKPNPGYLVFESPLVCAIKAQSFECMDLLLKGQADLNMYLYGFSPLSYAAKEGDTKYLKSLLEAGADPNLAAAGVIRPIEHAALARNREGVEILFPVTTKLHYIPKWTVDDIMEYCHTEQAKRTREGRTKLRMDALEKAGQMAVSKRDYHLAVIHYSAANHLDPSNPKWLSHRSLCLAHLGNRVHALYNAEECVRLNTSRPNPDPSGAAATLFRKFLIAGLVLMLNPYKKESTYAFEVGLFDLFASVYLMSSSPAEILSFTPNWS